MTIKLKTPPAKERIATSFKQLATVSQDLNTAFADFSETISAVEEALRKLKLGVSAWHQIAGHEEPDGGFWTRDIGFAQVRNKWGIALRRTWGNYNIDEYAEEVWLFTDAPRWICIESIGKLPDLFDDLIKRTEETTTKIKAKTSEAKEFAAAIAGAVSEDEPKLK